METVIVIICILGVVGIIFGLWLFPNKSSDKSDELVISGIMSPLHINCRSSFPTEELLSRDDELLKQQSPRKGWRPHDTGIIPVPFSAFVVVMYRNGVISDELQAIKVRWLRESEKNRNDDVLAYRVTYLSKTHDISS